MDGEAPAVVPLGVLGVRRGQTDTERSATSHRSAASRRSAIRGIEAHLGPKHADSFREDLHPDLRANFILANPPFNVSEWHGETLRDDVRWKYGAPPVGNANYAWVQHFIHHLAPGGVAGFVLANGSMSSMQSGEGEIRRKIVEADLVDCIVALPGQLFYATQIPVCLWFLAKDRHNGKFRDRRGETQGGAYADVPGLTWSRSTTPSSASCSTRSGGS